MAVDIASAWKDIEIRIHPYPFCASCQISSMDQKARSTNPLKPKEPFKWVFIDIITATAPKRLTSDTNFSNYIFIVEAYLKNPKLYGMNRINIE